MRADPRSPWEVQYSDLYHSSPRRRSIQANQHNAARLHHLHPHMLGLPLDVIMNHSESRLQAEDPLHGFHSGITGRIDPDCIFVSLCLPVQVVIGLLGCMLWRPVRAWLFLQAKSYPVHSWTDQGIATRPHHRYGHHLGAYQGELTSNQREMQEFPLQVNRLCRDIPTNHPYVHDAILNSRGKKKKSQLSLHHSVTPHPSRSHRGCFRPACFIINHSTV